MRNHLDGTAQVVSAALFQANFHVDLSGCNVVVSGEVDTQIPLVMPKVQITFATTTSRSQFLTNMRASQGPWEGKKSTAEAAYPSSRTKHSP